MLWAIVPRSSCFGGQISLLSADDDSANRAPVGLGFAGKEPGRPDGLVGVPQ